MGTREIGVWRLRRLQHASRHIEYAGVRRQERWTTPSRGLAQIAASGAREQPFRQQHIPSPVRGIRGPLPHRFTIAKRLLEKLIDTDAKRKEPLAHTFTLDLG